MCEKTFRSVHKQKKLNQEMSFSQILDVLAFCYLSSLPIIHRFEQPIQVLSFVKTTIERAELK